MKTSMKLSLVSLSMAAVFATAMPVYAKSSGWINANELEHFSNKVLRKGNIPVKISCKNNDAVTGMDRRNTLVKIEYKANTKNLQWRWGWGGNVGKWAARYKKEGYKMVSKSSFRRKSGLVVPCAIWHKP